MRNKNPSPQSILLHIAEEDIPANEIDLWSSLRDNLVKSKKFIQRGDFHMATSPLQRKGYKLAISAGFLALLILVLFLFTPQGMAFAQQILGYFKPVEYTTYPVPESQLTMQALDQTQTPAWSPSSTPISTKECPQTKHIFGLLG